MKKLLKVLVVCLAMAMTLGWMWIQQWRHCQ